MTYLISSNNNTAQYCSRLQSGDLGTAESILVVEREGHSEGCNFDCSLWFRVTLFPHRLLSTCTLVDKKKKNKSKKIRIKILKIE